MKSNDCAKRIPISKFAPGMSWITIRNTHAAGRQWVEQHWDKLDFVLGSVHYLERDDQMFDSVPAGAEQFAGRDIDAGLLPITFRRVREMAATGLVDCLSHLDLIKIHGHRPKAKSKTSSQRRSISLPRAASASSFPPPAGANR